MIIESRMTDLLIYLGLSTDSSRFFYRFIYFIQINLQIRQTILNNYKFFTIAQSYNDQPTIKIHDNWMTETVTIN